MGGRSQVQQRVTARACLGLWLGLAGCWTAVCAAGQAAVVHPQLWGSVPAALAPDPRLERHIDRLMGCLTLRQKVGQLIQADISAIRPSDLRRYPLGTILNGGGSKPDGDVLAPPSAWLSLANRFYEASLHPDAARCAVPEMWGMDAVHGANDVYGATIYPQNIALGAARDPQLMRAIGEATAEEVRAVGIDWTFGPTIAVVSDDRWGRTYESYSQNPHLVARYAREIVLGLQGVPGTVSFLDAYHVIATPKHFVGDGGTRGVDQGNNPESETLLRERDAVGYPAVLRAGAQVIMASFSSWQGVKMLANYGLLTEVLKKRWHFDGFVIGDWNAQGEVPGCSDVSCPLAVNAGLDVFMAPDGWKQLFRNTLRQVRSGQIPMARLDDAVRRVLRVKLRDHLFTEGPPRVRPLAGKFELLGDAAHRALARRAVRESLVLLKNAHRLLPLPPHERVLVTGDGANNIPMQCGGWTLTWQGTGTTNADFPHGESIWHGIQAAVRAAGGTAQLSADGRFTAKPNVAIVIYGEHPYAEFQGDVPNLEFSAGDDSQLQLIRRLRAQGIPVVSVFLSGRPLWVNPELNASTAFVAAWLPGSEGEGVADVLFRRPDGTIAHDFRGKLPFAWPRTPLQFGLDTPGKPLFPYGYGLTDADSAALARLSERTGLPALPAVNPNLFFSAGKVASGWHWAVAENAAAQVLARGIGHTPLGRLTLRAVDGRRQEDARELTWSGAGQATAELTGSTPIDLSRQANGQMALAFDYRVDQAPGAAVTLSMGCGAGCAGTVPITRELRAAPPGRWQHLAIPLNCFAKVGTSLKHVLTPFRIDSAGKLSVALAHIRLQAGGRGVVACPR